MQAAMAAARDTPPALPGEKPEPPNIITIGRSADPLQPRPGISKK